MSFSCKKLHLWQVKARGSWAAKGQILLKWLASRAIAVGESIDCLNRGSTDMYDASPRFDTNRRHLRSELFKKCRIRISAFQFLREKRRLILAIGRRMTKISKYEQDTRCWPWTELRAHLKMTELDAKFQMAELSFGKCTKWLSQEAVLWWMLVRARRNVWPTINATPHGTCINVAHESATPECSSSSLPILWNQSHFESCDSVN